MNPNPKTRFDYGMYEPPVSFKIRIPKPGTGLRTTHIASGLVDHENKSKWASKESLIVLTLILIFIFWIMEYIFGDTWSTVSAAFQSLSGVLFFLLIIIAVFGLRFIIKDRKQVWSLEREGLVLFTIGTLITVFLPLFGAISGEPPEVFFEKSLLGVGIGTALILLGFVIVAWNGGFFTIWFFGLIHYIVMSSHEAFLVVIYTHHYGPYDQYYANLGLTLVIISALLFMFHELKFLYLGKLVKSAYDLRLKGRYTEALKPLGKALRLYPRYATAWNNKGNVLSNMGRYEEALKCYEKALKIAPDYQVATHNKAIVLQKRAGS